MRESEIRKEDWASLKPTVHSAGINDVNYRIQITETLLDKNGKLRQKVTGICPYYDDWRGMVQRCFDHKLQQRNPTYKGCTMCEEWKYFSNFIKWVDSQPNKNWQDCQLDKDLLIKGNKHYSPETTLYLPHNVNVFLIDSAKSRGELMIGVCVEKSNRKNPFRAQCACRLVSGNKRGYLGLFPTELEAHKAWQAKKHEYACRFADLQDDPRVAQALRERYAPDKDWTSHSKEGM